MGVTERHCLEDEEPEGRRCTVTDNWADLCPICEYPFESCQCRCGGSAHPDRGDRARVVFDHLYLLTAGQLDHVMNIQSFWQTSYGDEKRDKTLLYLIRRAKESCGIDRPFMVRHDFEVQDDRGKVLKGLEICSEHGSWHGLDCELNDAYKDCPYRGCETGCIVTIAKDAITLIKEQEEQIKNRDESLEKAREEIKWLRGMLKEQEPVKPVNVHWEYGFNGGKCPKCMNFVQRSYNYCPFCGKAVKWE